MEEVRLRVARVSDAAALLAIYAPYVRDTAITFEYDVPGEGEFAARIEHTLEKFPYLVAEANGEIVGYAYAGAFHPRAAYQWCVEMSVYVKRDARRMGIGKKLYAAMEAAGPVLEMNKQSETELVPWVNRELAKGGKTMSDRMVRYLILQTGGSMTTLAAELTKLICYSDQPELRQADIDAVVIPVLEAVVFDITKDIGAKDFDSALKKLRDLLRQDTEPIMIAAVIGRQMRQMYGAKVLSEHGKDAYGLVSIFGIRDFAAKEVYRQARGYTKAQLKTAMGLCAEADYAMKSSGGDAAVVLETMILQLGQLGAAS